MLLLLFVSFFALFGNGMVLWRIGRGNPRMAGGALAHVGFAVLVLGVIASSGFARALPQLGQMQQADESKQVRENFVVTKGQTRSINGYRVTYTGQADAPRGRGVHPEHYRSEQPLLPDAPWWTVAYQGQGDQWFLHPDVKAFLEKDVFLAVTPKEATGIDQDASSPGGEFQLARGDSTMLGERKYAVAFRDFNVMKGPPAMMDPNAPTDDRIPEDAQMAVGAALDVTNLQTGETRTMLPHLHRDERRQPRSTWKRAWPTGNVRLAFTAMERDSGKRYASAVDGVDVMPDDWVVVQAYRSPSSASCGWASS